MANRSGSSVVHEPTYWDLADTWNPDGWEAFGLPIEGLVVLWDKTIHIEVMARGSARPSGPISRTL